MHSISLQLTLLHYRRANELVFGRILKSQPVSWAYRLVLVLVAALYLGAMFIISTAPNYQDANTLLLLRGSTIALVLAPVLFLVALAIERSRRVAAAVSELPAPAETIHLAATRDGLFAVTPGIKTEYMWSGVEMIVHDTEFAALSLPRSAPLPLPARAFPLPSDYFTFLRAVQDFSRAGAS